MRTMTVKVTSCTRTLCTAPSTRLSLSDRQIDRSIEISEPAAADRPIDVESASAGMAAKCLAAACPPENSHCGGLTPWSEQHRKHAGRFTEVERWGGGVQSRGIPGPLPSQMASASASAVTVPAEALLSPGFDAVGVTEGLRAHVGVEQLLRDLRSQLQGLRSTLVNLINHDYDELAGISSKLKGVDSKIERLKQPIEHLRQQHEQTKVASASSMARLQRMLAERGLVASARSQLQLFVQVGDSLASLQRLWVQASPSSPTGENVGFSGSPHHVSLERIAAEISALGKSCKRAPPHFSFIVQTLQCLGDHQTRLLDELGSTLSSSLAAGDDAASQSTLRAYAALEREAQAEELVLATFVQPAVAALVSQSTGDDGQLDLVRLYGGVEALVLGNPFACALRASSSLFTAEPCTRYDFVANSVWVEVFAAVKDSIFRPASQRFADNFRQSVKFLAFLESTYPTDAARQTFRTHRVTRNCEEKWSLHTKTYFQLHKNDIIRQVEQALAIGCPRKSGDETDITEPSFDEKKPSVIVWSCISSCWSPEAYLPPLAADFLLLSLQMVARYSTWIRQLSITELSVVDTTSASADQPCSLDDLVCAVVDAQILTR
jgi:hypothetical protein